MSGDLTGLCLFIPAHATFKDIFMNVPMYLVAQNVHVILLLMIQEYFLPLRISFSWESKQSQIWHPWKKGQEKKIRFIVWPKII